MSWARGRAEVEQLVHDGSLERVHGAQADGAMWLQRSRRILSSAEGIAADDPESAYVLVYDAARHACVALLAHQGIRATSKGGHYAVEQVVRAQFGPGLRDFGTLRRRRNELEYPAYPGASVEDEEIEQAVAACRRVQEAATALLGELRLL